jgi:isoquinoline 1-oxidoreductase alpha subunit
MTGRPGKITTMQTLNLNGRPTVVAAAGDTPLLWLLRGELKLTGTKFGCGAALCGACTVHVDGVPTRSCVTPLSAVDGKAVTTIEGLQGRIADAVRAAWLALDVVQCGYCQSGQIMAVTALLAANALPDDADIDAALAGNLCRCGTYPRIRAAIHDAAQRLRA